MAAKIVTLTTDFGLRDPYAAEMKAAILSISPHAVIVDVTHEVASFNVRMGAFVLASAAPHFPEGTVHVVVVDPKVGTNRRPVIVQTQHGFFVGPDNGVLVLAAEAQGIKHVFEITSRQLMLPHVSSTFHGRDIFAPTVAHLINGVPPEEFGPEISYLEKPAFAKVTKEKDAVHGEVLHVDGFGNIITNLHVKDVEHFRGGMVQVKLPQHTVELRLAETYAEAKLNQPIGLIGSHNYLEIALNQGNASTEYHAVPGDKIKLSPA